MSAPRSAHLAQVSVEALAPQVVVDLVAAFRLELNKVVPALLAPLLKELKDLNSGGGLGKNPGGDNILSALASDKDAEGDNIHSALASDKGGDKFRNALASDNGAGAPDAAAHAKSSAGRRLSWGEEVDVPSQENNTTSGKEVQKAIEGPPKIEQMADSEDSFSRTQKDIMTIEGLPQRMEVEMSTPLIDPFGAAEPLGSARSSLQWPWTRLSGQRSSAREGYRYNHLKASDELEEESCEVSNTFRHQSEYFQRQQNSKPRTSVFARSSGLRASILEEESQPTRDSQDFSHIPSWKSDVLERIESSGRFSISYQTRSSLTTTSFKKKLKNARASLKNSRAGAEDIAIKKQVTRFLEDPDSSKAAEHFNRAFAAYTLCAIWVGLLPYMGITVPQSFNAAIDSVLCFEHLVRTVFCPSLTVFLSTPSNIIDCLSAAPLTVIILMHFGVVGEVGGNDFLLSAIPLIRFLRFVRRFPKMQILFSAFVDCLEALPVLMFTLAVMGCIFTSSLYLVESREDLPTLSESAWLVISTISTVGYGDITPRSKAGCALASVLMVVSQLYMAMPFGIIGYNFTVIWEHRAEILLLNMTRERLAKWGVGPYEIPRLFELFDLDESAEFDMQEFQMLFMEMEMGFREREITDLFKLIDKDAGGTVDEREFVKTVFPNEFRNMYGRSTKKTKLDLIGEEVEEIEPRASEMDIRSSTLTRLDSTDAFAS